jgi:hypothetical protein
VYNCSEFATSFDLVGNQARIASICGAIEARDDIGKASKVIGELDAILQKTVFKKTARARTDVITRQTESNQAGTPNLSSRTSSG